MHSISPQKQKIYFLSIVLLHLLWFTGALFWKHTHNGDTDDYIFLAQNIKKGIYYSANLAQPIYDFGFSNRTPLYSLLLLFSYSVFGITDWPVIIFQNLLSIASCWVILKTFLHLFPTKKQSWIYLLLLAFYPAQMCFASIIAPDIIMQFLLALYLKELLVSIKKPSNKGILKMGLWLILATLAKPVMYPFLMLHIAYSIWHFYKTKTAVAIIWGILPLLTMMSYGLWNKSRTGLYHISSIQSENLLNANARGFLISKYGREYSDSVIDAANTRVNKQHGLKAKYELASFEANTIIKSDLTGYAFYHLKETCRFFLVPGKFDQEIFMGLTTDNHDQKKVPDFYQAFKHNGFQGGLNYLKTGAIFPIIILIIIFNIIRILGWFLFLCDKQYSLQLKIFTTVYIFYFAIITGPVSNTRYFLPVLLVMSALSMLGFAGIMERRKEKSTNSQSISL